MLMNIVNNNDFCACISFFSSAFHRFIATLPFKMPYRIRKWKAHSINNCSHLSAEWTIFQWESAHFKYLLFSFLSASFNISPFWFLSTRHPVPVEPHQFWNQIKNFVTANNVAHFWAVKRSYLLTKNRYSVLALCAFSIRAHLLIHLRKRYAEILIWLHTIRAHFYQSYRIKSLFC